MEERDKYADFLSRERPWLRVDGNLLDALLSNAGLYEDGEFDTLPFTPRRAQYLLEEVDRLGIAAPTPPALEGKWFRASGYCLHEGWVEASGRRVSTYALTDDVLEGAVRDLLRLTPDPEPAGGRKKPSLLMPPLPEETGKRVVGFFRAWGPAGLALRDLYGISVSVLGGTDGPVRPEVRIICGPPLRRTDPASLPLEEFFGGHLRDSEAAVKVKMARLTTPAGRVRGLCLEKEALWREYRETLLEVVGAAWEFKLVCLGLEGRVDHPFALDEMEEILGRSRPRLSREGAPSITFQPRCLLDACYLYFLRGKLKAGTVWRTCPGCGRDFLPRGRERYCTRQCQSRHNTRAFWERERARRRGS